jgi:hypothetical protein
MKLLLLLLVVLVTAGTGCGTHSDPRNIAGLRKELKAVTVADGISESEARIIGDCYFAEYVGCGAFSGVTDGGDHWIVNGGIGVAPISVHGFYIEKRTGKVVSAIGPSFTSPLDIIP